ncbi:MAG: SUMF1/EgtB/PvdO family nonheme iron enzyme, partial [Magnetococcales bacterium]|nr:SUMF1/EgtB/PvdO family nonheme iron enzyme [Magnetococcales bacterium]
SNTFEKTEKSNWESPGFMQQEDHPVVNVSHDDAMAFAEWLSWRSHRLVRLPTEAEWEYACRAKSETMFHCGDQITIEQANFAGHYGGTTAVTRFPPNSYGLHDMHGNVYEWGRDWYDATFYAHSPNKNPVCLNDDSGERVLRGGSWHTQMGRIHSFARDRYSPGLADADIGFRLAALSYPWEK